MSKDFREILEYADINSDAGEIIIEVLKRYLRSAFLVEIDIVDIANQADVPTYLVKHVLYLLLAMGMLQPYPDSGFYIRCKFLPIHPVCRRPMGECETSVNEIYTKFERYEYGNYCSFCNGALLDCEKDLEIQMIFCGRRVFGPPQKKH